MFRCLVFVASGLLVQHILNEGFDTGKPLLVKHVTPCDVMESPWASFVSGAPLPPFGLGYVKGMLRATTCLALLHLFWADGKGTALLRTFSKIKESCEVIYVQHVVLPSLENEIVNNFLLSISAMPWNTSCSGASLAKVLMWTSKLPSPSGAEKTPGITGHCFIL